MGERTSPTVMSAVFFRRGGTTIAGEDEIGVDGSPALLVPDTKGYLLLEAPTQEGSR